MPMEGELTYMKLNHKITRYIVELCPVMVELVEDDRCIYTLNMKAIYGFIQASALCYVLICKALEGLGCQVSEMDHCIFRKQNGFYYM